MDTVRQTGGMVVAVLHIKVVRAQCKVTAYSGTRMVVISVLHAHDPCATYTPYHVRLVYSTR